MPPRQFPSRNAQPSVASRLGSLGNPGPGSSGRTVPEPGKGLSAAGLRATPPPHFASNTRTRGVAVGAAWYLIYEALMHLDHTLRTLDELDEFSRSRHKEWRGKKKGDLGVIWADKPSPSNGVFAV